MDCGWRKCPCCESANPKGFTACLNCRVMFTFEPIAKVSKVARRIVGKGENAGFPPVSSVSDVMANVSIERAVKESVT